MATRSSYRRKAPSTPEKQGPFFDKEQTSHPFFRPSSEPIVQTKLTIGQPGDVFEQEADRMADSVVNHQSSPQVQQKQDGALHRQSMEKEEEPVQRQPEIKEEEPVQKQAEMEEEEPVQKQAEMEEEEPVQKQAEIKEEEPIQKQTEKEEEKSLQQQTKDEEDKPVQTKANAPHTAPANLSQRLSDNRAQGKPLPASTQAEMSNAIGYDFSDVVIHTDAQSVRMNQELRSQAFTHRKDIYFNQSRYDPESRSGKHLLAHELTHVVQQGGNDIQPKKEDGHDLRSSRFKGTDRLEQAFDNEQHISQGSSGAHVVKLQQALVDIGFELPEYGVDGIFGSETRRSIIEFQQEFGLQVDGIVGPETLGALDNIFASEGTEEEYEDADVLDGDSGEGLTFPVGEYSITQIGQEIEGTINQKEIQLAPLKPPPETVKPPSVEKVLINLTEQNLKILWSDGKLRGPYTISSGRGCPNTEKDPCVNPKRGDRDTYCTPQGSFKAESLGGEDYKSRSGDAMSWYVAFGSERGIGIHNAQPVTGTPRSHGCVRVPESIAKLIHNNVTNKTIIAVAGKAPTKPWKLKESKATTSYKGCPGKQSGK